MSDRWTLHLGDVADVVRSLPDNSFDALLCDPPYGLSFMGKRWDYDVPSTETWAECLRVLKPGAPLLAFFGTRTYHRGVVRIEDAGFEIRDQLAWMFGSGFPKSLDISKAIDASAGAKREVVGTKRGQGSIPNDRGNWGLKPNTPVDITAPATESARDWSGYGTALKPAFEPCALARKPIEGTVAANVAKWGVGGLAIDACRIGTTAEERAVIDRRSGAGYGTGNCGIAGIGRDPGERFTSHESGRWPANVLLDEEAAAALDAMTGELKSGDPGTPKRTAKGMVLQGGGNGTPLTGYGDSGGASRFFYTSKASREQREFGLSEFDPVTGGEMTGREDGSAGTKSPRAGAGRNGGRRNVHPTVKPISLARYLARLVLPPPREGSPRQLLVPFAGSGSEMIGAIRAGWDHVVGIERDAHYASIARARLDRWANVAEWLDDDEVKESDADERQPSLFGKAV